MIARQLAPHLLVAIIFVQAAQPSFAQRPKVDVYGDPLPTGAIARMGTVRWRAEGPIVVAMMLDSKSTLTVTEDNLVQIWDTVTGVEARRFDAGGGTDDRATALLRRARPSALRSLAVSRDGKLLATFGKDRDIHVWNVEVGKEVRKLGLANVFPRNLSLSNDGRRLMVNSMMGGSQICDTLGTEAPIALGGGKNASGAFEATMSAHYFAPDGKTLLQITTDGAAPGRKPTIVIWDTATGAEKQRLKDLAIPDGNYVLPQQIVVSFDHRVVAVPLPNKVVFVSLTDGKELGHIDGGFPDPRQLFLFAPDGTSLIGASGPSESLTVWEVPSGKVLRQLGEPPARRLNAGIDVGDRMGSAEVSPDGKALLWCNGSAMSLIDLETGKLLNGTAGHTGPLKEAFFSVDGGTVYTRANDFVVRRWDAKTGKETDRLNAPKVANSFIISPDGRWFATAEFMGKVTLFDAISLKEKHVFSPGERTIGTSIVFSPDSKYLAHASRVKRTVVVYDVITGEKWAQVSLGGATPNPDDPLGAVDISNRTPLRTTFSRDGRLLCVASDRQITVWDVGRARPVGQIPLGEETLRHAVLSPDNLTVAIETSAGTSIWELATFLKRLSLHQNEAPSRTDRAASLRAILEDAPTPSPLAYSPDGRLLARAGEDRRIRVWDTWTGKEIASFTGHHGTLMSVSFSPDGQRLVTGSSDTTALVWDLALNQDHLAIRSRNLEQSAIESNWSDLMEQDAGRAWLAMRALASDPVHVVPFLGELVKPATGPDPKTLTKLVADLGDSKFVVRERASEQLRELGEQAATALRQAAANHASAEVRKSAQKLLDGITITAPTRAQLRAVRIVEVLERAGTPEAVELLNTLAGGAADTTPTPQAKAALTRLAARR